MQQLSANLWNDVCPEVQKINLDYRSNVDCTHASVPSAGTSFSGDP